uniref:beta-galactosidase-1-like protein 2 n=1 Tax=Gasterosteus aculeatus aculeatus TaxID=481459 RepID=UPI001A98538D|nr:beta-galactosidase-1-like protein 2 [Gasterosteus aculeatus aculeatus]
MSRGDGLRANSSQFTLGGEPFRILGGSIHYFRVPRAYWEDRLLKMKACGLNTLTTYVPWNLHEPQRGTFNFQDQLDLTAYFTLAAQLGLWVILRPGPYICAEWDLGGLPSWLLQDKGMRLRTTYPGFVDAVNLYFDKLVAVIKPLMFREGGPVIAVQVENEYGSYAKDVKYMPLIQNLLQSRGIKELLLTSDNWEGLSYAAMEGVLKTINLQRLSFGAIQRLADMQPQKPLMVMEYWSGWFDVWGGRHHVFHSEDMLPVVSELLTRGVSINLYMFHGGTSFGFMNGAMDVDTYKPQVTSYDYDAPLSEAGDCTVKYRLLRNLLSQFHSEPLPVEPVPQERRAYEPAAIQQHLSLWDSLPFTDKVSYSPPPHNPPAPLCTRFGMSHFVHSLLNSFHVFCALKGEVTLSLLVENCGRVNYGKALDEQRKGIVGDILLNHTPLIGFTIFCLDMKPGFVNSLMHSGQWKSDFKSPSIPGFFRARLYVDGPPRDTFLRLPGWGKGVVFVNGKNLGRHWCIGPQLFLYLPGPWLRSGENQIIVFEEQQVDDKIQFAENPDHGRTIDVYKLPFCTLL